MRVSDDVKQFVELASHDEAFKNQLHAMAEQPRYQVVQECIMYAKAHGLNLDEDDFNPNKHVELDPAELAGVVGSSNAGADCAIVGFGWGGTQTSAEGWHGGLNSCYVIGVGWGETTEKVVDPDMEERKEREGRAD